MSATQPNDVLTYDVSKKQSEINALFSSTIYSYDDEPFFLIKR
ncbi:MAG: hypothetical protein RSC28_06075 [Bacteroidales bacterium]